MARCVVVGASGYLGKRLLPLLADQGHTVVAVSRSGDVGRREGVRAIKGDATEPTIMRAALVGAEVVYFLMHSLDRSDFAAVDRRAAEVLAAEAATAGIRQVVYVGGPRPTERRRLSKHLASRAEVGDILLAGEVPALALQASMIIGANSASFEMLRALACTSPAVPYPCWMRRQSAPVAVADLLHYLTSAANLAQPVNGAFEVAGPQQLSYFQLIQRCARVAGMPARAPIPVPLWSHGLAAALAGLGTAVTPTVAFRLLNSLEHDLAGSSRDGKDIARVIADPPGGRTSVERAMRTALGKELATDSARPTAAGRYVDQRVVDTDAGVERLWQVITGLGGPQGWHTLPLAWTLRGTLDHLVGGIGLHRGRPPTLTRGDTTDFWTVLRRDDNAHELTLQADMRIPGETQLLLGASPLPRNRSRYRQTITFAPDGLAGQLYWLAQKPAHDLVFGLMARNLARHAAITPVEVDALHAQVCSRNRRELGRYEAS